MHFFQKHFLFYVLGVLCGLFRFNPPRPRGGGVGATLPPLDGFSGTAQNAL